MPRASQATSDFKGDHLSVKMFGAVGDGVTDDTSALQAAIDAVSLIHGRLLIPPGKYLISSTLNVQNQITIEGMQATTRYFPVPSGGDSIGTLLYYTGTGIAIDVKNNGGAGAAGAKYVVRAILRNFRICAGGGAPQTISAATAASPAVLTKVAHGLTTGQAVNVSGFTGSWAKANGAWLVTVLGANAFSIDLDSSTFGAISGTPIYRAGAEAAIRMYNVQESEIDHVNISDSYDVALGVFATGIICAGLNTHTAIHDGNIANTPVLIDFRYDGVTDGNSSAAVYGMNLFNASAAAVKIGEVAGLEIGPNNWIEGVKKVIWIDNTGVPALGCVVDGLRFHHNAVYNSPLTPYPDCRLLKLTHGDDTTGIVVHNARFTENLINSDSGSAYLFEVLYGSTTRSQDFAEFTVQNNDLWGGATSAAYSDNTAKVVWRFRDNVVYDHFWGSPHAEVPEFSGNGTWYSLNKGTMDGNDAVVLKPSSFVIIRPGNGKAGAVVKPSVIPGGTWHVEDTDGTTQSIVKAGASQGSTPINVWYDAAGNAIAYVGADGRLNSPRFEQLNAGGGVVNLIEGDATHTGFLELRKADGTRLGFIGYSATDFDITTENGAVFKINGAAPLTALPNTGTAGTYTKVTTDPQGRVSSGTTLADADIPTNSRPINTQSGDLGPAGANTRALNTVYQNTTGKPKWVSVNCGIPAGVVSLNGLTDGSNPPTTAVAQQGNYGTATNAVQVIFPVLAGNYYKVTAPGGSGNPVWFEWS